MGLILQIIYSDTYMGCDHAAFNSEVLVGYSIVVRRSPDPAPCLYIRSAASNKVAFIQTSPVSPPEMARNIEAIKRCLVTPGSQSNPVQPSWPANIRPEAVSLSVRDHLDSRLVELLLGYP